MENWLSIATAVYLLGMVLYGHHKGFIRLAVSIAALFATLIIVRVAMPQVSAVLKDRTPVYQMLEDSMRKMTGAEDISPERTEVPSEQRLVIEDLNLPQALKDILIENNNNEVYKLLGVDAFVDYLTSYLAGILLNALLFLLAFIVVFAGLQLLMSWLNLMARLPLIHGLNQVAGAVLGGVEGLIFLWILCIVVTVLGGTPFGMTVMEQIETSRWLAYLYDHNLISRIFMGILYGVP